MPLRISKGKDEMILCLNCTFIYADGISTLLTQSPLAATASSTTARSRLQPASEVLFDRDGSHEYMASVESGVTHEGCYLVWPMDLRIFEDNGCEETRF